MAIKVRSKDCIDMENMNMFSSPAIRVASGGLDCFTVVVVEVMVDLLRVLAIMLAKPMIMTEMIDRESKPPVSVLY